MTAAMAVSTRLALSESSLTPLSLNLSATDAILYGHVAAKHAKESATPEKCFARLKGYDPNAPCPPAPAPKAKKVEPKKKKGGEDLSALLSEGLSVGGKKKK